MILKETKYNIDKFTEVYEKDRFLARIYALEKSPSISYVVLNDVSKTQFQIFYTTHKYGVSKTLRRYISKKSDRKVFVNGGRFFMIEKGKTFPLNLRHLDNTIRDLFIERFSWIRFLIECRFEGLPFNSIVRHKLYSRDKVLRHLYKCPAEKAEIIRSNINQLEWRKILKSAHNIENVNPELLQAQTLLVDACELAWRLNEKVNLAWSKNRLKSEHDKWSREYTEYVVKMDNEPLNIHKVFIDFNDYLGGGLLKQSGELASEGMLQKHCVASYKNRVNSGGCAIFHINNHTAEIIYNGNKIYVGQFKGIRNIEAPFELRTDLMGKIDLFNDKIKNKRYEHKNFLPLDATVDLPF